MPDLITRRSEVAPSTVVLVPLMAQLPRVPNLETQREAMKKLGFLVGKWAGEARLLRGSAESVELLQTEEAQYKLDGLIVVIEGIGRTKIGVVKDVEEITSRMERNPLCKSELPAQRQIDLRSAESAQGISSQISLTVQVDGVRPGARFGA